MRTVSWLAIFFFLATGVGAQANTDPADLLKAGRADQALHALNLTVAQNPNDARAYHLLSRVYFQLELWDNAVRMAEKAIALARRTAPTTCGWAGPWDGKRRTPIRSPHLAWREE